MLSSLLESRTRCRAQQNAANALDKAWLRSLDSDCRRAIHRGKHHDRRSQNGQFNSKIVELVDSMMLRLRDYAIEFNLAVAWNLHVTATPPSYVTETVAVNSHREATHSITTYRARLATRLWSLILRAERNRLEFFLIPTQSVLGLSKTEHEYPPVSAVSFDGESFWQDGRRVSLSDGGENLCRFIFRMLVAKCIQDVEIKCSDPFTAMFDSDQDDDDAPGSRQILQTLRAQAADKEAPACAVPPPGKDVKSPSPKNLSLLSQRERTSFPESANESSEITVDLHSALASEAEKNQTAMWRSPISEWEPIPFLEEDLLPLQNGSLITNAYMEPAIMTRYDVYNDVLLCFTFLAERVDVAISDLADLGSHAFRRRDLNAVKRCCLDLVAAQANEIKVIELRREWIAMNEISELLAECSEYGALSHRHDPASSNISNDVPSALRCLIESVDVVAEAMIECGAKAFSARDFERVDRFRRLAVTALQFKARAEMLRDEWCTQVPDASISNAEGNETKPQQQIRYVSSIKALAASAS